MIRHSCLQRDVLSLYRSLLRAARPKGQATVDMVRQQFRQNSQSIKKSNFMAIEFRLRKGKRDLAMLKS